MIGEKEYILAIIKNFVVREKQDRFRGFIESRRDDLLDEMFIDQRNLKQEILVEVPRGKSADFVINDLMRRGATDEAYAISHSSELDGKLTTLGDAIELEFDTHVGTLVYCIGTRLGYYEDGETSNFILDARSGRG